MSKSFLKNIILKNIMKKGVALAALVWLSQLAPVAHAQPDLNEQSKAENPAVRERVEKPANGMGVPDEAIRKMMTLGGVPDVATQDAVLEHMKEDVEARKPLRALGLKLFEALRAGDVNDDQMLALITDYRAAQDAEGTRREDAQHVLDAKVNFTRNPRLEAMLLLAGLIGDGSGLMNAGPGGYGGYGGRNQYGQPGAIMGLNAQKREENRRKLLERFDKNGNGQIDLDEDAALKQWRLEREQQREQKENPANKNAVVAPLPVPIPEPLQGAMPVPLSQRAPNAPILPLPTDDELAEDLKT